MARPVPSITCLFTLLAPATLLIAPCASVHDMSCRIEHINQRIETVQQACDCASTLPEDAYAFERYACLTELVDWQMEGN